MIAGHAMPRGGALLSALLPDLDAAPSPAIEPPDPTVLAASLLTERMAALEAAHAAELRAACEAAGAAGRAEAEAAAAASHEAALTATLATAAQGLDAADGVARDMAEVNARALAGLLLTALEALVPQAAARDAAEAIPRMVQALLPGLRNEPGIRVLVATELVERVGARLTDPRIAVQPDATLAPGELRVEWRDGGAERRLAERMAAVRAVLREAGLIGNEGE